LGEWVVGRVEDWGLFLDLDGTSIAGASAPAVETVRSRWVKGRE
jgi:hypothetical protein